MKKMLTFSVVILGLLVSSMSHADEGKRTPNSAGEFAAPKAVSQSERLEIYAALLGNATAKLSSPDTGSMAQALSEVFTAGATVSVMRDSKTGVCRASSSSNGEGHILDFKCDKDSKGRVKISKISYVEAG